MIYKSLIFNRELLHTNCAEINHSEVVKVTFMPINMAHSN